MSDVNILSLKSANEIKKHIIPNVKTETIYRKWERRYLVALTEDEKQKCKMKMRLYHD